MRKAPKDSEPTLTAGKVNTDGAQTVNLPKLFSAVPFNLPGHSWIPIEWLDRFPPDSVIRTFEDLALVRRHGKTERMFPEPREGAQPACAWSEKKYQQETQKFLSVDRDIEANLLA